MAIAMDIAVAQSASATPFMEESPAVTSFLQASRASLAETRVGRILRKGFPKNGLYYVEMCPGSEIKQLNDDKIEEETQSKIERIYRTEAKSKRGGER